MASRVLVAGIYRPAMLEFAAPDKPSLPHGRSAVGRSRPHLGRHRALPSERDGGRIGDGRGADRRAGDGARTRASSEGRRGSTTSPPARPGSGRSVPPRGRARACPPAPTSSSASDSPSRRPCEAIPAARRRLPSRPPGVEPHGQGHVRPGGGLLPLQDLRLGPHAGARRERRQPHPDDPRGGARAGSEGPEEVHGEPGPARHLLRQGREEAEGHGLPGGDAVVGELRPADGGGLQAGAGRHRDHRAARRRHEAHAVAGGGHRERRPRRTRWGR